MSGSRIYALPVLGRYGLTHGLLAWARCQIWCQQTGATMLAPFWFKLRVGPYLRGERDKRNYFLLFKPGNAVGGARRLFALAGAKKIEVGPQWPESPIRPAGTVVMRFHNALKDNEKKSFAQIIGHGQFLRSELLAMTRPRFRPATPAASFIAIHVRMGDFTPVSSNGQIANSSNAQLPIGWYVDRLAALRGQLGGSVPAIVFSDGSDEQLAPLLDLDDVSRAPRQQSVTDLLQIGLGAALIASGSGFSLWGAFLGSTPRIAHPGQAIVPIDTDPTRDIESAFGAGIPPSFIEHVRQRLRG